MSLTFKWRYFTNRRLSTTPPGGPTVHNARDGQRQMITPMNAKILIVDDDLDIVMMLEDRLQASGYETVVATEGQQAIDQIVHESPQLILLDLTLPKVSGLDVL